MHSSIFTLTTLQLFGSLLLYYLYPRLAYAQDEDFPFNDYTLPWDERVDDLVSRLTVDEITLQMANGGRVTNAPAIERLGIKPYGWGAECLHGAGQSGNATSFPQAIGLSAIFSPDMHFAFSTAVGLEVRSKHNNYSAHEDYGEHTSASCWSPVVNILRDPRWGRNQETYGEDPYMTGVLATMYVKGLQGDDPRYVRANAGCKHFAAYSGPENIPESRMSFNAVITERDFRLTYLPAFQRCVEAGTYSIMCSYNAINGVPACANEYLLTDILRKEWGFKGYVISDEIAIENMRLRHGYTDSAVETCGVSVKAVCNLEDGPPFPPPDFLYISDAVAQGVLSEEEVREAVKPLFYTRMRLGQFDPPEMNQYAQLDPRDYVQSLAHQNLSLTLALMSFVLLKNNNGFLPLSATNKFGKVAVVGPFGENIGAFFGNYAPDPDPAYIVTPLEGLSQLGETVSFAEGCQLGNTRCPNYDPETVIDAVTGADIVFVCIGTGRAVEAESNDREDIDLPGFQLQLLQDAVNNAGGAPVVVLLFNGGPLDVTWAKNSAQVVAMIECFFPAQTAGEALRRVLVNEGPHSNPAGRLPITWPAFLDQYPPMIDYSMQNRTYRYFTGVPLYPFGYGLSYSTFRYTSLIIRGPSVDNDIFVDVTLVNDGPRDGDEVVQLYVEWTNPILPTPKLQLVGFNRYTLAVDQGLTASFTITMKQLAVWRDEPTEYVTLAGEYTLYGGGQQPGQVTSAPSNHVTAKFSLATEFTWPVTKSTTT